MPVLNWKDESRHYQLEFQPEALPHPLLEMTAPISLYEGFARELDGIASGAESELRWVLSDQITLFIKKKPDGDSRLLLAHPEEKEWVGTLSLNETTLSRLHENLKKLPESKTFKMGDFVSLGRTSNLNIRFSV